MINVLALQFRGLNWVWLSLAVLLGVWAVVFALYGKDWLMARMCGVRVGLGAMVGMSLRGVRPSEIVSCKIMAQKAGIDVTVAQLEALFLTGADIRQVTQSVIEAKKAGRGSEWNQAVREVLAKNSNS